jgi:hypothetical protein
MLRKLRIVFSVLCGMVCLLLIVLWGRSYWKYDGVSRFDANQVLTSLDSRIGRLTFAQIDYTTISPVRMETHGWRWEGNQPLTEFGGDAPTPSFEWSREKFGFAAVIPHWFPVIIFAGFGIAVDNLVE